MKTKMPPKIAHKPVARGTQAAKAGHAKLAVKAKPVAVAAGESTFKNVDNTAASIVKVPVATVGGQQARAATFLNKGINSSEALLAKLDGIKSDGEAAAFLADQLILSNVEVA